MVDSSGSNGCQFPPAAILGQKRCRPEKADDRSSEYFARLRQPLFLTHGSVLEASFFLSPRFKFENAVQLRDALLRTRLWCHNASSRIFTSADVSPADDLYVTLGFFSWITRV